jgi:hypothetical protein
MVAPVIIQILFWIGVVFCVATGILFICAGRQLCADLTGGMTGPVPGDTAGDIAPVVGAFSRTATWTGLAYIFLGPLVLRVYAELLIVIFRIHDTLKEIKRNTEPTVP